MGVCENQVLQDNRGDIRYYMKNWISKPTGDMTLSVLPEQGLQILKIDMLPAKTMSAGTGGNILCRSLNDLFVIAKFSNCLYSFFVDDLPYPDSGLSPLPWEISYDMNKRKIAVKCFGNKLIASRIFPKSVTEETIIEIVNIIEKGIKHLSISKFNDENYEHKL